MPGHLQIRGFIAQNLLIAHIAAAPAGKFHQPELVDGLIGQRALGMKHPGTILDEQILGCLPLHTGGPGHMGATLFGIIQKPLALLDDVLAGKSDLKMIRRGRLNRFGNPQMTRWGTGPPG